MWQKDPSVRGNTRAMIIGWTYEGRILEIGIEYFEDEDREHICENDKSLTPYLVSAVD